MKLLLDECTPRRLKLDFTPHELFTVDDVGLKGVKSGALLRAAAAEGFDVLITVDRKIPFQQNLATLRSGMEPHGSEIRDQVSGR